MKNKVIPFVTASIAAAFVAAPAFAHPRPSILPATGVHGQQDDKPPANPPEKPKPQEPDPKPANPPSHEPDKPPAKPAPSRQENPPNKPDNPDKPAKPEKQPQQDKQQNQNNMRNSQTEQSKKSPHAQANVHYSFRSQDKTTLKQHFETQLRSVNRSNRPHIRIGGFIPSESVSLIQPVPVEVIALLPPIPEGCVVGFWDGYVIVYYPDDFYIVTYIDLL
jgi:outer membrane biosynthesis protein TonB